MNWMNGHFRSWRWGLAWQNRKTFGILRYNDVNILCLGVFQIGKTTGRSCHG